MLIMPEELQRRREIEIKKLKEERKLRAYAIWLSNNRNAEEQSRKEETETPVTVQTDKDANARSIPKLYGVQSR